MLLILCLIAWKEPMGDAELLALLDVGQDHLEEGVAGADGLEREPDRRLLEGPGDPERGGRAPGLTEGAVVGDEDPVERGGRRGGGSHRANGPG